MSLRHDAAIVAAHLTIELERFASEAGGGAVATVGELTLEPGVINVIPGGARLSLDNRAPPQGVIDAIESQARRFVTEMAERRGVTATIEERQRVKPTVLDPRVIESLAGGAAAAGVPWRRMISGAAHDTMCVAARVPSAMLFIPCRGGISHSPAEYASPADAALGAEVLLNAVIELS
jgi:hydantoinase/carbamoylase family amidase